MHPKTNLFFIGLAVLASACRTAPPSPPNSRPEPPATPAPTVETRKPSESPTDPVAQWVDTYVAALGVDDETQAFHGSFLLARGPRVVASGTYRARPGRRYRIGSVTKPFTAVAIVQLAAAGKLSLDDSLRSFIPELPDTHRAITLEQVLSHRSGLGSYTENEALMATRQRPRSRKEMIQVIAQEPLRFPAGEKWAYSNSGYFLLGVVIERVAGQSYPEYLRQHVFAPAGMSETSTTDAALAAPLTVREGALAPADPVDVSIPFAAGALVSTTRDMHRFALALRGDALLSRRWRDEMWRDRGGPTPELGWGLGWMIREHEGKITVGHNGGIDGFRSHFEMHRDGDEIVVALSRLESFAAGDVATPALQMMLTGKAVPPPEPPAYLAFDGDHCGRFAGAYEVAPSTLEKLSGKIGPEAAASIATVTLRCDDARYLLKPVGQDEFELKRRDDGVLAQPRIKVEVVAETPSADGVVSALTLKQGGLRVPYRRR
ncbi:MAG: serine hydrolase domain-containing protein [Myxococcota bacterium]